MLATAAGMSLSMLVGGYAAHATAAIVVASALWGYAYGLLSSLGPAAAAVGLNSVVALVIADAFAGNSSAAVPLQALLVLAGGVEQTVLLVVLWPTRRYSQERHALGDAFRALGIFALEMRAGGAIAAPHPASIAAARDTLADPAPFARRGQTAVFRALLDEAERIRAALGALVTDRYRYERRGNAQRVREIDELGAASAAVLEEIADALHEARAPRPGERQWARLERAAAAFDTAEGTTARHARAQAQALLGQLRTVTRIAATPAQAAATDAMPRRPVLPPLRRSLVVLRSNLGFDSPYGRHAVRLAFAIGVAMLVARLGPFSRGYWIPMTAALVLRPDFRTTFVRGFARIAGTLLGAVVATAIVAALPGSPHLDAALAILFAALGYVVFGLNYAAYSVTVTAYVVFLLALSGNVPEHDAVLARAVATLAGAGLAAAVYLAWPTWESQRARLMLAAQLEAYRAYANAILSAYVDPGRLDRKRLRDLQMRSWRARTMAETSVDTMLAEPERTYAITPSVALGILAAEQRIGVALLALNEHLGRSGAHAAPRPQLEPLAAALDAAWEHCIARLRQRTSVPPMPPLRDRYREAETALAGDADGAIVLWECDLLVDGLNTVAELLTPARA